MKKYVHMIKAPTPSFSLPGHGYLRLKAGDTIELTEDQHRTVTSEGFTYRQYFMFIGEKEVV